MLRHKFVGTAFLCALLAISLVGVALANGALDGQDPAMMVSPSTIVLAKVRVITVHTNIPSCLVDPESLDLNGAAPMSVN